MRVGVQKNRLFWSFLISYLFILVLPLFLGMYLYHQSENRITMHVESQNYELLERVEEVFTVNIDTAKSMLTQLWMNPYVTTYMYNQKGLSIEEQTYRLREIITSLSSFSFADNPISGYYIWFRDSGIVLYNNAVYTARTFYDFFFPTCGSTYEEWIESLTIKSPYMGFYRTSKMMFSGVTKQVYEYSVTIPFSSNRSVLGSIHVLIDESRVQDLMKTYSGPGQLFSYIMDNEGNIVSLFSSHGYEDIVLPLALPVTDLGGYFMTSIGDEKAFVSYLPASDGEWFYVTANSLDAVLKDVYDLRTLSLIILSITLICATLLSLLFSYRTSSPLVQTLATLFPQGTPPTGRTTLSSLQVLQNSVTKLVGERFALEDEMSRYRPVIQMAFLSRLLDGELSDPAIVEESFHSMGIDGLADYHYSVVLVNFDDYAMFSSIRMKEEIHAMKLIVAEYIERTNDDNHFFNVELGEAIMAFIGVYPLSHVSEDHEEITELFKKIAREINTHIPVRVSFILGEFCSQPENLYRSYESARYVLHNIKLKGKESSGVYRFSEYQHFDESFEFPLAMEIRLSHLIGEGKFNEARELFMGFVNEYIHPRELSNELLYTVFYSIKGMLMRLNRELFSSDREQYESLNVQIVNMSSFNADAILSIIQLICLLITSRKELAKTHLKQSILDYLQAHYQEQDFYLPSLAQHFNMTETYLSLLFKEEVGESFTSYLEGVRLEEACKLLKKVSISIDEISSTVGYSSSHSFRRAFKRKFYVTPGEYRLKFVNYGSGE